VGYAARTEDFDFDYFQSLGHISISEQDLYVLFPEVMLSVQPSKALSEHVRTLFSRPAHKRDVKFSHFVQGEEKQAGSLTTKSTVRVNTLLQTVQSATEAYSIARDAFLAHLKRLLRIPEQEGLVGRGADSLVAVDIQAWMLK
jgi:hypothetical protein